MSARIHVVDAFLEALEILTPLTPDFREYLHAQALVETYPAYTIIHSIRQPAQRLYYLYTGLARSYYIKATGEPGTSRFFKPRTFLYSPYTFLTDHPALECVELLQAGTLVSVSFQSLREGDSYTPTTAELSAALSRQHAILNEERLRAFRDLNSEELYQWFLNRHPDLYGLIPHKILASFLGIAPETLSRIQNKKNSDKNLKKNN